MAGSDNNINFGDGVRLEPSDSRGHGIMQKSGDDIGLMNVSGDPEGVVPANPGSKAFDRSSGCEYIKVSGTGVTGWERIESGETVATTYQADSGSAQAAGNILNLSGGTGIDTTGAGSTVTFNFDETEVPAIATSYETQSGTAVPVNNILQVDGIEETSTRGSGDTVSVFSPRLAKFVVDPTTDLGTHTTIQGAIDDASAGDSICVRPGTYTENITLKSDICIFAHAQQTNSSGDAAIVGKVSLGTATNATVVGFRMTDNGDVQIEDTGSTSGTVTFQLCSISGDGSHNVINCSNTNRVLTFQRCGLSSPAGAKILNSSGGTIIFRYCECSAGASTISTISAGSLNFTSCLGCFPFQTTGTGSFTASHSTISSSNQTLIDHQGATQGIMQQCSLRTNGTAVAINVGAGATIISTGTDINTANATPITGTGTFNYDSVGWIQNAPNAIAPSASFGSKRIRILELDTALDEVYGGTGQTTYSTGDILYASGSNTLAKLAAGTNGHVLTLAAGVPSWAAASGGGMPDEVFYFKATDFDALETNFAPLVQDNGSNAKVMVRAFDDSTEEYVNFSLKVPADIDTSGSVTFRVWMYAATAAASKNVALTFDHRPLDNSESWDQTYTSEDSGDIAIDATQDDITEATWTETVTNLAWAAHDIVLCRLSRPNAAANDLTGDLYVLGFAVEIPRA